MESKNNKKINTRVWALFIFFFCIGFVVLIGRLFKIQVLEGDYYKAVTLTQNESMVNLEAKRGTIYDRNQKALAQSAVVWDVCISPLDIKKDEEWELIATNLAVILEIPKEDILSNKEKKTYYAKLKGGVDTAVKEKVEGFKDTNKDISRHIYFKESLKRFYAYDQLGSTLIGFTNTEHNGAYGIESYYDSILSGTPGVKAPTITSGSGTATQSINAEDGHSLVLTLDEVVESAVEKHLEMAIIEHSVQNGATGIFMNIQTGEILAMANAPDFNPNKPYELTYEKAALALEELEAEEGTEEYDALKQDLLYYQWRNKAISDPYEPGSVYKIITASIALEENKSFLNDNSFYCSGSIKVEDRVMNCHLRTGHGQQDFYGIMKNSCNPGFVTLGQRNGAELSRDYLKDFGLDKSTGIDLPGEVNSILVPDFNSMRNVSLSSTSFGQSNKITPIQMITSASAAVNGGYLVEPYVVHKVIDSQGNVISTVEPKVKRQVISKDTSDKIKLLVEEVVSNGTGKHAGVPGYRIGGKTGTSEKLDLLPRKEYVLSFIGFAPMENPTYACLIVLDEPQLNNVYASVIAAPVVGAIFQEVLPYLGVEPHYTDQELAQVQIEVPYLIGSKPHDAQAALTALGLQTNMIGAGKSVLKQVPLATETLTKGRTVKLFCSEEELNTNIIMPDLTNMPKEQARQKLHDMGLNVSVVGATTSQDTVVSEQWPLPGEILTSGDIVKITISVKSSTGELEPLPELPTPPALPTDPDTEGGVTVTEPDPVPSGDTEPKPEPDPKPQPKPDPEPTTPPKGATGEELD